MSLRRSIWLTPAALLLAGCSTTGGDSDGAAAGAPNTAARAAPRGYAVTRDDLRLPPMCRPGAVAERLVRFTTAYNAGLTARSARRTFAGGSRFRWFSMTFGGGRGALVSAHFVTRRRSGIRPYALRRHGERERMRFLEIGVGSVGRGRVGASVRLDVRGRDLARGGVGNTRAIGKLGVNCGDGRIEVWSTSLPTNARPLHQARVCPQLSPPPRRPIAIACTTGAG